MQDDAGALFTDGSILASAGCILVGGSGTGRQREKSNFGRDEGLYALRPVNVRYKELVARLI